MVIGFVSQKRVAAFQCQRVLSAIVLWAIASNCSSVIRRSTWCSSQYFAPYSGIYTILCCQ